MPTFGNQINFHVELALLIRFVVAVLAGSWYNSLLMRGGSRNTFILSTMLCDFIVYIIFTQGFYVSNVIYGVDQTGWQPLIWIYVLAQVFYITLFNVLIANRAWTCGLKVGILAFQFMLMAFSGVFTGPYLNNAENQGPDLVSKIGIVSPSVQLFMGLFKIMYRYPRYALQNEDNVTLAPVETHTTVEPFGEYGAQLQLKILLIQTGVYALLLIIFI